MVVVWVTEAGWAAAMEAALEHSHSSDELLLLYVVPGDIEEVPGAVFAGLTRRGRPEVDLGLAARAAVERTADELLAAARARAGNRVVRVLRRRGRPEREVLAAAGGARLLVLTRDGDLRRLGPRSLGPRARFVLDHAPCAVLLVWVGEVPDADGAR